MKQRIIKSIKDISTSLLALAVAGSVIVYGPGLFSLRLYIDEAFAAQFARPDSDVSTGLWSATPLWQKVDESTRSDADLISSDNNTSPDIAELGLSNISDPQTSTGHILRYTYRKSAAGGHTIDFTARLMQGTTEIASWTHTNISETFTLATQTLTGVQADSITDYTDLRVRVERGGTTGGNPGTRRTADVSWIEFEVPDQPPVFSQNAFRFYEDGTESGSAPIDTQDTNITRDVTSDSNLHLRFRIQETNGASGISTDDWQLQYSKNAGAYTDVTTSSSNIVGFNSSNLTDGGATTNRPTNGISDGTGSFVAGEIAEDGLIDDHQLTASNFTEDLYSLTLISADLADGDTLDFRVLWNGGTITYSITPRITASKPGAGPTVDQVLRHGNFFSGGSEQYLFWAN